MGKIEKKGEYNDKRKCVERGIDTKEGEGLRAEGNGKRETRREGEVAGAALSGRRKEDELVKITRAGLHKC